MKWPSHRSLFGRSVTALVAFTLVFQFLAYTVSSALIVWPLLKSAADDLAGIMVLSTKAMANLPVNGRPKLMADLRSLNRLNVSIANGPLPGRRSWIPFVSQLEKSLSNKLGKSTEVRIENGTYHVDIAVPGLTLRYAFPHSRLGTNPMLAAAILFLGTLALSYAAAIVVAGRLANPLNSLSAAAAEVGRGGTPQINHHNRIAELDTLVTSFNRMAREVQALISNRTTLLAGISHDLRSPIARARVALQLAKELPDATLMDDIGRYLTQMETLLAEFLEFAGGVGNFQTAQMPLNDVITNLCDELARTKPNIKCVCEKIPFKVNRIALERTVTNLIENAQRYSGDQLVEVRCQLDMGRASIEVLDRGPGIPQEKRAQVFEPFVRLEGSRNRATGGSGLGLSIVREICASRGWLIELSDREGGGLIARLIINEGERAEI